MSPQRHTQGLFWSVLSIPVALWAGTAPRSTIFHPEDSFGAVSGELAAEPPLVSILCPERGGGAVALLHTGTLWQVATGALPRALLALQLLQASLWLICQYYVLPARFENTL